MNKSFLARHERAALAWLVARLPAFVTPNHLTGLGLFGAALTGAALAACHLSSWFLLSAVLGLAINWFGDSLDGSLARHRRIERPRFGYFLDHSTDLIAQTLILGGLGVSPYFTLISALLALSMYLLMSSYTYLKVMVQGTHQLSYGGMGATELRILIGAWSLFAAEIGPSLVAGRIFGVNGLDLVVGSLWCLIFFGFMWIVRGDLRAIEDEQVGGESPTAAVARDMSSAVVTG